MFQAIAADINCMKLPCLLACTSTSNGFPELGTVSYPNSCTPQEGKWEGKSV